MFLAAAAGVESVEKYFLPIDLVSSARLLLLRRLGRLSGRLLLVLFLVFDHVEEGIVEQFLLEVLLKIEQRHVEKIHRLVKARIDLQFLPQRRGLVHSCFHTAVPPFSVAANRARSRAVRVGPR